MDTGCGRNLLVELYCQCGHLELAEGGDGQRWLECAIEAVPKSLPVRETELGYHLGRLSDAVQAKRAGERLWRGETVAGLPPGLRWWLIENGLLES